MTQLQFIGEDNKPLGAISWFPVHPTSMNNTNRLVSSDNVGYASILFEKELNGKDYVVGKVRFFFENNSKAVYQTSHVTSATGM